MSERKKSEKCKKLTNKIKNVKKKFHRNKNEKII